MGQCLAPCVKEVSEAEYKSLTDEITRFLNGGYNDIKKDLTEKMTEAAEQLDFERAKDFRDKIIHIDTIMEKQK